MYIIIITCFLKKIKRLQWKCVLSDYGILYGNQEDGGIRIVDSANNKYYEIAIFGDNIMDISLNPNPHDMEIIKFKINDGEYQILARDYSEKLKFI